MSSHTKLTPGAFALRFFWCDLHYNHLFASQLSQGANGLLLVSAHPISFSSGFCEFSIAGQRERNYSVRFDNEDGVLRTEKGPFSSTFVILNGLAEPEVQQEAE